MLYAFGKTDAVVGTGMLSFIAFSRDDEEKTDEVAAPKEEDEEEDC